MRVLHLGCGFTPWRPGGLIRYAEDVMHRQVADGHEVHYLCSGRHFPRIGGARLKRRRHGGVQMHEVVNPPILVGFERGTRDPDADLEQPQMQRLFARVLADVRPDVLHVQELLGWPSAVLVMARRAGVPVVMTLQDYAPLCPSVRLLRADGRACVDGEIDAGCAAACGDAPSDAGALIERTLRYELTRARMAVPGVRRVSFGALAPILEPLVRRPAAPASPTATRLPSVADIRRRREVNAARLSRVDRLVAQSHRVEELYRRLGVENPNLQTLQLTCAHLERLTPRAPGRGDPLVFATIDGLSSPAKGSRMLVDAVRRLRESGAAFRLLVYGWVEASAAAEVASWPEVELRGLFGPADLDQLLEEVDVGLLCSQWEEAYAYVGLEFLAKGIPLLATARGGIIDYAREGETAWLNLSGTAGELAAHMLRLIGRPEEVTELARRVASRRAAIVKPLARHCRELEALYRDAVSDVASNRRRVSSPIPRLPAS